jgi:hypothetical protein
MRWLNVVRALSVIDRRVSKEDMKKEIARAKERADRRAEHAAAERVIVREGGSYAYHRDL